jgi:hypothetical protein
MSTLYEDFFTFMIISRWIIPKTWNVLDKIVEKIKARFKSNKIFRKSHRFWDNVDTNGSRTRLSVTLYVHCQSCYDYLMIYSLR